MKKIPAGPVGKTIAPSNAMHTALLVVLTPAATTTPVGAENFLNIFKDVTS
jgi:hypothetical protein